MYHLGITKSSLAGLLGPAEVMGISVPRKQGNVHCRSGRCFWARPLKGRDFQGAPGGRGLEHCSGDATRVGDKSPSPSETPKLATSCFAGRGQPLCSDPPTPPLRLPKPHRGQESGAEEWSLPSVREHELLRSVAPGSYITCSVRFKCHCCRQLTQVPTQWAARGPLHLPGGN